MRNGFRHDDRGVNEVVGFVLSFALSAVFLMIAMNTFFVARGNSDQVVTAAELKTIADRVSSRLVEVAQTGQEFPNVTLNLTFNLPTHLNGHPYYVEVTSALIYANTTDLPLSATATTFRLDGVQDFDVSGRVYSTGELVVLTYSLQNNGATRNIHIHSLEE